MTSPLRIVTKKCECDVTLQVSKSKLLLILGTQKVAGRTRIQNLSHNFITMACNYNHGTTYCCKYSGKHSKMYENVLVSKEANFVSTQEIPLKSCWILYVLPRACYLISQSTFKHGHLRLFVKIDHFLQENNTHRCHTGGPGWNIFEFIKSLIKANCEFEVTYGTKKWISASKNDGTYCTTLQISGSQFEKVMGLWNTCASLPVVWKSSTCFHATGKWNTFENARNFGTIFNTFRGHQPISDVFKMNFYLDVTPPLRQARRKVRQWRNIAIFCVSPLKINPLET